MALCKEAIATAFNNKPELQHFVLTDVTSSHEILGTGSFGSVEKVVYNGCVCAGKKLHDHLIAENETADSILSKYLEECRLTCSLRHPNIIQVYGLCLLSDYVLPFLVMEHLHYSLDAFLADNPHCLPTRKFSILEDVARGLTYLHERRQPVIHRDLTAKNVLLTSSLRAKITDMGNSRIMEPGKIAMTLSRQPGTKVYMPPEAETGHYGPALDIFSFGHLTLCVMIQMFPSNLLPGTYCNPANPDELVPRSEVERREEYIESLKNIAGPPTVDLVKQCLHNAQEKRPTSPDVLLRLRQLNSTLPIEDHANVRQEVSPSDSLQSRDTKITQPTSELEKLQVIPALHFRGEKACEMPFAMGNYVQSVVVQGMLYVGGGDSEKPCDDSVILEYSTTAKKWSQFICSVCYFTMAVINNQLARVGGYKGGQREKTLEIWSESTRKWARHYQPMSIARARCSVVVSGGWLVVAGGWSKSTDGHALDSIEVLDITRNQWHRGPSTPTPWFAMRAVCVRDDTCYFMGGYTSSDDKSFGTGKVYSASLKDLVNARSTCMYNEVWTEATPLQSLKYSSPLSFSGSLYVFGGEVEKGQESAQIQLYEPDTGNWAEVGMLCFPRSKCTCSLLNDGRIVVAGGNVGSSTFLKTVEFCSLSRNSSPS